MIAINMARLGGTPAYFGQTNATLRVGLQKARQSKTTESMKSKEETENEIRHNQEMASFYGSKMTQDLQNHKKYQQGAAIVDGLLPAIDYLIDKGIDPNQKVTDYDWSQLADAELKGYLQKIQHYADPQNSPWKAHFDCTWAEGSEEAVVLETGDPALYGLTSEDLQNVQAQNQQYADYFAGIKDQTILEVVTDYYIQQTNRALAEQRDLQTIKSWYGFEIANYYQNADTESTLLKGADSFLQLKEKMQTLSVVLKDLSVKSHQSYLYNLSMWQPYAESCRSGS